MVWTKISIHIQEFINLHGIHFWNTQKYSNYGIDIKTNLLFDGHPSTSDEVVGVSFWRGRPLLVVRAGGGGVEAHGARVGRRQGQGGPAFGRLATTPGDGAAAHRALGRTLAARFAHFAQLLGAGTRANSTGALGVVGIGRGGGGGGCHHGRVHELPQRRVPGLQVVHGKGAEFFTILLKYTQVGPSSRIIRANYFYCGLYFFFFKYNILLLLNIKVVQNLQIFKNKRWFF